jgi:hypothetical protein
MDTATPDRLIVPDGPLQLVARVVVGWTLKLPINNFDNLYRVYPYERGR